MNFKYHDINKAIKTLLAKIEWNEGDKGRCALYPRYAHSRAEDEVKGPCTLCLALLFLDIPSYVLFIRFHVLNTVLCSLPFFLFIKVTQVIPHFLSTSFSKLSS